MKTEFKHDTYFRQAIFLPALCLAMALWANMEDKQSQHLYRTEDNGHCMRNNGEKVVTNKVSTLMRLC